MEPAATTELYRQIHDHVRDIILVIDADTGRIVEANAAAEHAYQYPRDQLLALTIFDLRGETTIVEGRGRVIDQMRSADRQGFLFETVHRRKDGSVFPVEVSSRGATLDDRSRYLLSIIRDITERRRADEERERLLATAQQALAMREEFLWVASHELRTPLTIVSLQLHQLRRSIDRGDPVDRLAASTEAALSHVERLSLLVQRLLDAAQLDNGPKLEILDMDLGEVTRSAVERIRPQADAAGIALTVELPSLRGRWDPLRLEQVVTNLLSNALKYGLRQPIRIALRGDGDVVHIEVADGGIGLAASETERIFGKFERAVSTAHYGGLGLGLYIARQIVEAHRGQIVVESAPGRGATFKVTLPWLPAGSVGELVEDRVADRVRDPGLDSGIRELAALDGVVDEADLDKDGRHGGAE